MSRPRPGARCRCSGRYPSLVRDADRRHLAIDTTAGERERKSLELPLTLPVRRTSLLLGKMAATIVTCSLRL
jgi:hypothetical protein